MRVVNVLAGAALAGALGFAWWSSRQRDVPPPLAGSGSAGSAAAAPGHPSPLEIYATARVGDWHAYSVANESPFGSIPTHAVTTVTEATDAMVTIAVRGRLDQTGEIRDGRAEQYPRGGLTLERLTGDDIGNWTIFDVAVFDEPHEVNGRTFACKRITFGSKDPMFPTKRTRTDYWISTEVPAGGLVEKREVQDLDGQIFRMTLEVIGFGSGSATTWGERPEGL
jgi:hypothetical protein